MIRLRRIQRGEQHLARVKKKACKPKPARTRIISARCKPSTHLLPLMQLRLLCPPPFSLTLAVPLGLVFSLLPALHCIPRFLPGNKQRAASKVQVVAADQEALGYAGPRLVFQRQLCWAEDSCKPCVTVGCPASLNGHFHGHSLRALNKLLNK